MKARTAAIFAVACATIVGGIAQAGSITIDALGGDLTLQSGNMSSLFSGASAHTFSGAELRDVHDTLHSDGVSTDGLITFMLVDSSDGLTFVSLLDDPTVGGTAGGQNTLGMSSTAPSHTDYWINDLAGDPIVVNDPFGITTTVSGEFGWGDNRGDGFAWSNLQEGDGVTFNFSRILGDAIASTGAFQFVTWNGSEWEVVGIGDFNERGQFAFAFTVVPLPAPLLLGLAGLGGVAMLRRRRIA